MRKGDYELSVGMWGRLSGSMTFLESSVSGNRMNYSSPTFDQLIEEATTKYANDPETRWQTLIKAEKVLVEEDAALIPLYQEARSQLVRPVSKVFSIITSVQRAHISMPIKNKLVNERGTKSLWILLHAQKLINGGNRSNTTRCSDLNNF